MALAITSSDVHSGDHVAPLTFRGLQLPGPALHTRFNYALTRLLHPELSTRHHAPQLGSRGGALATGSSPAAASASFAILMRGSPSVEVDLSGNDPDAATLRMMLHDLARHCADLHVTALRLNALPCARHEGSELSPVLDSLVDLLHAIQHVRRIDADSRLQQLSLEGWRLGASVSTSNVPSAHAYVRALPKLVQACYSCTHLVRLSLAQCDLRLPDLSLLAPLLECNALRHLDLSRNFFAAFTAAPPPRTSTANGNHLRRASVRKASVVSPAAAAHGRPASPRAPVAVDEAFAASDAGIAWQQLVAESSTRVPSSVGGLAIPAYVQHFAAALCGPACNVTHLYMRQCAMTDGVLAGILHAVRANTSLLFLDVSANTPSPKLAPLLADMVANNETLQELRAGFQPLSRDGTQQVLQALQRNAALSCLYLENAYLDGQVAAAPACETLHRGLLIDAISDASAARTVLATLNMDAPESVRTVVSPSDRSAVPTASRRASSVPVSGGKGAQALALAGRAGALATLTGAKLGVTLGVKNPNTFAAIPSAPLPDVSALQMVMYAASRTASPRSTVVPSVGVFPKFSEDDAQRTVAKLWEFVDRVMQQRPKFCRVVLEYPERPRLTAGILKRLDFTDEELADDGMGWLRGSRDAANRKRAWNLHRSVWANRPAESDSGDFVDTNAVLARAFENDWANTKLHRVIREQSDRAAVKPILKLRYHLLREVFRFFAAQGGDAFSMTFAQFTDMRRAMGFDVAGRTAELDMAFFSADGGAQMRGTLGQVDGKAPTSPRGQPSKRGGFGSGSTPQTARGAAPDASQAGATTARGLTKVRSFTLKAAGQGIVGAAKAEAAAALPMTARGTPASSSDGNVITSSNPANALMRHEILEAFVRLALAAYRPAGSDRSTGMLTSRGSPQLTGRTPHDTPAPSTARRSQSPPLTGRAGSSGHRSGAASRADDVDGRPMSARPGSSALPEEESPVVSAVRRAVEDHLVPAVTALLNIPPENLDDAYSNFFRRNRMYTEEVDDVLRRFDSVLRRLFALFGDEAMTNFMQLSGWMRMLAKLGVFDGSVHTRIEPPRDPTGGDAEAGPGSTTTRDLSGRVPAGGVTASGASASPTKHVEFKEKDARLLFTYSVMTIVDELHRPAKLARVSNHTTLTYTGFLEAVCRLADSPVCPADLPWDVRKAQAGAASPAPVLAAAQGDRASGGLVPGGGARTLSSPPTRRASAATGRPAGTAAAFNASLQASSFALQGDSSAVPVKGAVAVSVRDSGRPTAATAGEDSGGPSAAHLAVAASTRRSSTDAAVASSLAGGPADAGSRKLTVVRAGGATVRKAVRRVSSKDPTPAATVTSGSVNDTLALAGSSQSSSSLIRGAVGVDDAHDHVAPPSSPAANTVRDASPVARVPVPVLQLGAVANRLFGPAAEAPAAAANSAGKPEIVSTGSEPSGPSPAQARAAQKQGVPTPARTDARATSVPPTVAAATRRMSIAGAATNATARTKRTSAGAAVKGKPREPPKELPARLEILLTHLAFVENVPLRGIERRFFK